MFLSGKKKENGDGNLHKNDDDDDDEVDNHGDTMRVSDWSQKSGL